MVCAGQPRSKLDRISPIAAMNQLDRGSRGRSFFLSSSMNKSTQVLMLIALAWLTACGGGDPNAVSSPTSAQSSQAQLANNPMMAKALGASVIDATPSDLVNQAVNLQDAIAILKLIVGLDVNAGGQPVTSYQLFAADFDGNGKVELADAIGVLKHVVGLDSPSPKWVFFNTYGSAPVISDKLNPGLPPELRAVIDGSTAAQISLVPVLRGDVVGSAMNYSWTLGAKPAGSSAVLAGAITATPTFTADLAGDYVATLRVTDGSSNIASTTVTMTAGASKYDISGMASGINANFPLTLKNSSGDTLLVSANGTFVFPNQQAYGTNYSITVSAQPLGQICAVVGGTGTVTGPMINLSVACSEPPYFVEVPNAFPDPGYMYTLGANGIVSGPYTGGIIFATPIKKLPNGSPGIIYSAGMSNPDPTKSCFGRVYVFEYKNGKFNDVTSSMLDGSNSLEGFPSVTAVDDINGDGITDFVSGVTQDCGRTAQTNSNALVAAQPFALVSNAQTGKYRVIHFSYPDGWENIRILTEADGSKTIALGGYNFSNSQNGGAYKYKFDGTNIIAVANDFPAPNAQGFTIYSTSGALGYDTLIQPGQTTAVESFLKSANGSWVSGGTINSPYPTLGYSLYTGWTGGFSTVPVINMGGNAVIGAPDRGLIATNSCKIRISPTSGYSVLMMLPVNVISNYVPGEPIADSMTNTGRISTGVKWLGAYMKNGVLTQSDPVIVNEQTTNNGGGFNQFDCRDINGDGYDDLVGYALWQGDVDTNAFPIVYLNQKNGTFKRSTVGETMSFKIGYQVNQHTSIMADIDGDGIDDLIIFPGNAGGNNLLSGAMKFYKGLKPLDK